MSVSAASVRNESSSDGCGAVGWSFCNREVAIMSHCIPDNIGEYRLISDLRTSKILTLQR